MGGYSVPAPGRVCTTEAVRDEDGGHALSSAVCNFYREIHADGSAFAALPLSEPNGQSSFTIAMDRLVDKVATATANTLDWTGSRTGRWGASTVTAGIVVSGAEPALLRADGIGGVGSGRTILRPVDCRPPHAVTTVELAHTATMQSRMVVAYAWPHP